MMACGVVSICKHRAISVIVSSVQQEGKRLATELTAAGASPVLAPYMVPSPIHPHAPPPQPTHLSQHLHPGTSSLTAVTAIEKSTFTTFSG